MVEVPLEIEAELPREFDGAAILASSGLPRKVRIKAPKDSLKLSTAYRADQLLGDVVRVALRGTPADVSKVQDAASAFVKKVRERRHDGASLTVLSNGRGKIDLQESIPAPPKPGAPAAPPTPAPPAAAVPGDKLAALEKRLAKLEGDGTSEVREQLQRLASQLSALEARIAKMEERPPSARTAAAQALASPGAERSRGSLRRATAVDAFAEGLRSDLRARTAELLRGAEKASMLCDRAFVLVAEAERELEARAGAVGERLRSLSSEAAARQRALERVGVEVDLYTAPELPIASQLVERLAKGGDGPDPLPVLRGVVEGVLKAGAGGAALEGWLSRALPLCGWTPIVPRPGEAFSAELHEALDRPGDRVSVLVAPGARREDGQVLRARVLTQAERAEQAAAAPAQEELPEAETIPDDAHAGEATPGGASASPAGQAAVPEEELHPEAEMVPEEEEAHPAGPAPAAAASPADEPPAAPAPPAAAAEEPAGPPRAPPGEGGATDFADGAAAEAAAWAQAAEQEAATRAQEAAAAAPAAPVEGGDAAAPPAGLDEEALAAQVAMAVEVETAEDRDWAQVARGPEAFDAAGAATGAAEAEIEVIEEVAEAEVVEAAPPAPPPDDEGVVKP